MIRKVWEWFKRHWQASFGVPVIVCLAHYFLENFMINNILGFFGLKMPIVSFSTTMSPSW